MSLKRLFKKITPFGFLLGIVYALVLNVVLFNQSYFSSLWVFMLATICTSAIGMGLGFLHYLPVLRVTRIWAGRLSIAGRVFINLLFFGITMGVTTVVFFGYNWVHFPGYVLRMENYKWAILVGIVADLLGIGFGMALHSQTALKQAEVERERLQKLQLQNELELLKNQVNPHFLFNSLNVLSSLITEDAGKAEEFVNQLSKVYRYVLQNNRYIWTSLQRELDFIQAYGYLLSTRYGDALRLTIEAEQSALERQLPPLALQLLVENAVKHNVVHKSQPLTIEIIAQADILQVRNNLQKKARSQVLSHGVGLTNIADKYRLLNDQSIFIEENEKSFCVKLPLLAPDVAAA